MKYYYLTFLFFSTLLLTSFPLVSAQDIKDENEKSINREDMPTSSLAMINRFWNKEKKVDFYRQNNGEMISYEAKLEWNGHQYSIEFDSEGSLINVEQLIDFKDIPVASQNTITEELSKQYTRFRFTRIQRQYSAEEADDRDEILEDVIDEDYEDLIIRFEIVVDAQNKAVMGSFEWLFDEQGNMIQKRRIVRRSLDNIW
jgi:hypothetical protein